jgi:hypothetical protein
MNIYKKHVFMKEKDLIKRGSREELMKIQENE